jgi:hypothetical protein
MVVRVATVAFEGIEARPVDVQVQIANGNVVFLWLASATRRSLNRAREFAWILERGATGSMRTGFARLCQVL